MEFIVGEGLTYNIYQGKDDANNAKLTPAKVKMALMVWKMVLVALQYNSIGSKYR